MELQYISGETFKEFYLRNRDRFDELLMTKANDIFQYFKDSKFVDVNDFFEIYHKMIELLIEDRRHELVTLAKERGRTGAMKDFPLGFVFEFFQGVRRLYWDFLHRYNSLADTDIDREGFFELERTTNFSLDTYINHYFASYLEHKNELLRAQRETIDELTVPIIPLSDTMGVLPVVGTMDTFRAKTIQERALKQIDTLKLQRIVIDFSGVAYMDTAVVGHLFRIVEGMTLLGCNAIVTGIRPEIANTMIEMGITITDKIETKGTLQQALEEYGLR